MRVGIGYDVHKYKHGKGITLGGVFIPCEFALVAHSDGDVLIHAIIDALLGASGLGDIGQHFPDNDDSYSGISSLVLLERVCKLLKDNNYSIVNIDSTVIAQAPKISSIKATMEATIAEALGITTEQVNVKATTEEHMGFTGELKGIKAEAICLLEQIN